MIKTMNAGRPPLWTRDFVLAFASNLLLFFSFYMLVPVLPFYLLERLGTSGSLAGIILSLYTISALLIRPFSGYLVDTFARKPLYLICYAFFCAVFAGYTVAASLALFVLLRVLHGFAFGITTVSSSTVAVDVMTSERRGEGIGYFGMAANISMAIGPVVGLWLHKSHSFEVVFLAAFASSLIGFFIITLIRPIVKPHPAPGETPALSLDRFVLVKGLPCVLQLFVTGLGYGAVLNYVGLYSERVAFRCNAGMFFMVISIGLVLARIISARAINRGKVVMLIYAGSGVLAASFGLFMLCDNSLMLYAVAFLLGMGFGFSNPAFQSMLIDLGQHNQRGTANATYFSFLDMGIGLGIAIGGTVIDRLGFTWLYGLCGGLLVIGTLYFAVVSAPYFRKNRLR